MTLRNVTLVSMFAAAFAACPPSPATDGGMGGAGGGAAGAGGRLERCTQGCPANRVCNEARGTCDDPCAANDAGGCPNNEVCTNVGPGQYQCTALVTTCNSTVCAAGQVACLQGQCSCLSSAAAGIDSCNSAGRWCAGGSCQSPKVYQECKTDAGTSCPSGSICEPVFGTQLCVRTCMSNANCERGEACAGGSIGGFCLQSGFFIGGACSQTRLVAADAGIDGGLVLLADGGSEVVPGFPCVRSTDGGCDTLTVAVSNTCRLAGDPEGVGSGNCSYATISFFGSQFNGGTCRPPGTAQLGQRCLPNFEQGTVNTQCATGLECAVTRGSNEGVCLRACNVLRPSDGKCGAEQACVNIYRLTDSRDNAVLGVCMNRCNVFDASGNCAAVGTTPTSCAPVPANGELSVSIDGTGVCMPQQMAVAQAGQPCTEPDAFRGAVCGNGQLCLRAPGAQASTCTQVCDLSCNVTDGGIAPARCNTQPNGRCAGGKRCASRTSTTGTRMGYCE
jgi:hypothetical protein